MQYLQDLPRAVYLMKAASFPYLSSALSLVRKKILSSFHIQAPILPSWKWILR